MKIFLFRHGNVNNPKNVLPVRLSGFHLNNVGKEKVAQTAKSLKNQNITRIYSSPLERTKETAEIIADIIGIPRNNIEIRSEIIEVESLRWQGKDKKDFEKNSKYVQNPLITSDMEGRKDSGKRVFDFLKDISASQGNAVVVSHGDPIMGAIGWITNDWSKIDNNYIKKGEFYVVTVGNGKWKVEW